MKKDKKITLIKIGGSVISDKNTPYSLRIDVINQIINEIIQFKEPLIIVHGGGSYGHPIAKKYKLVSGYHPEVENQIFGLSETHQAMNKLNNIIIEGFLKKKYPVYSLQPSSFFFKHGELKFYGKEIIEVMIERNIIPILYGDLLFSSNGDFSIISGDTIVSEICKTFLNHINKVIFTIEENGIYTQSNGKELLQTNIKYSDIEHLNISPKNQKIDVTGGIHKKLSEIKQIIELGIPVQIINGIQAQNIIKALNNIPILSTYIHPKIIEKK